VLLVIKGLYPSSIARSLWQRLEERKLWGHHAVIFGAVCADIGVETEKALLTYLYAAVSSLVSAGVRLIPLGHSDGQLAIGELKPVMTRITMAVALLGESDICTFAPALEVRAMQHEHLFTRLFKS
jgi:urease accessory protein